MAHFEIEIKSLLGEVERAHALKERMHALDAACSQTATSKQLNHYFEGGSIDALYDIVAPHYDEESKQKLRQTIDKGSDFSVRTRESNGKVLLVVKASIDEGTSANTVKRMEFEEAVNISLDELDALVLEAGFQYQAKWSREREEYSYKGINVCLDRNAGYGYLAEFEKIVSNESEADSVRKELDEIMSELEVVELSQDRLARMFDHYNKNWRDYYGTDKVFFIE